METPDELRQPAHSAPDQESSERGSRRWNVYQATEDRIRAALQEKYGEFKKGDKVYQDIKPDIQLTITKGFHFDSSGKVWVHLINAKTKEELTLPVSRIKQA